MTVTAVYDINKKKVGEIELPDEVFKGEVDKGLIHQMVTVLLSNARSGSANTKTRAEVRGGGAKPWKQKGTGRARHGSLRSPIFVGGGAAWGPKTRDWHISVPKKQKKVALRMALSMKNVDGELFVLDNFDSADGKTKSMAKSLKNWESKSTIIVTGKQNEKALRAVNNIPNVKVVLDKDLNIYDMVKFNHMLLTKESVGNLVNRVAQL